MRAAAILAALVLMTSCSLMPTKPIAPAPVVVTQTQEIVKLPPAALLTVPVLPQVPDSSTATQVTVANYLLNLYADDVACRAKVQGIANFFKD